MLPPLSFIQENKVLCITARAPTNLQRTIPWQLQDQMCGVIAKKQTTKHSSTGN